MKEVAGRVDGVGGYLNAGVGADGGRTVLPAQQRRPSGQGMKHAEIVLEALFFLAYHLNEF